MQKFIVALSDQKTQRMMEWRNSTERENYPLKLSKNLLYEALTILDMWNELKKSFKTFHLFRNKKMFENFSDAHEYIYDKRRQIQTEKILPILDNKYLNVKSLPSLEFDTFRDLSQKACYGTSSEIEEIEFTYFFHTTAYELIYGWGATGMIGLNKEDAFQNLSLAKWDGIDYNSIDSLVEAFGKSANFHYKTLPNL